MKNQWKYCLAIPCVVLMAACKKLPDGFISEGIRYEQSPITIQQGRTVSSTALNVDGSSQPIRVKVLHFYDRTTGAVVDDLFNKEYKIKVWKAVYDPYKDTTMALLSAKMADSTVKPVNINAASGQLEANYTTANIPVGKYAFDLEISNPAGTRKYEKIGEFDIVAGTLWEVPSPSTASAYKVGEETKTNALTAPQVTIKRTAAEVSKVILRYVDKNGTPFNPQAGEIATRPTPGLSTGSLQTMKIYALKTEIFNDRMEFTFGTNPFPLISLGNGLNYYYRIPAQYLIFDNPNLVSGAWSANPRFSFQGFQPGIYEITVKLTDVTRKAG